VHPDPDQTVIAQVKVCPNCGHEVAADAQKPHVLYDKIKIPPVLPVVTRVRQYGGQCTQCGQPYVAPVPVGLEPASPYGTSVENLVTFGATLMPSVTNGCVGC
jgi:rRNA maturation protein Nop10